MTERAGNRTTNPMIGGRPLYLLTTHSNVNGVSSENLTTFCPIVLTSAPSASTSSSHCVRTWSQYRSKSGSYSFLSSHLSVQIQVRRSRSADPVSHSALHLVPKEKKTQTKLFKENISSSLFCGHSREKN